MCPFSLGRKKGIEEFEAFFLDAAAGANEFCDTVGHPRAGVLINSFHATMEVTNIEDAVCPGSGHVDFSAIAAAPGEIGLDGDLMIEGFGYLAAGRNSRGPISGGI